MPRIDRMVKEPRPKSVSLTRLKREITLAEDRLAPHIIRTPLEHSPALSRLTGAEIYLKHEEMQITGSFKFRGAVNTLLCLSPEQRRRGVVAASSGNHGIAVAAALALTSGAGTIVVPTTASSNKVERIRSYGVSVRRHGSDCVIAEAFGRRLAARTGCAFISPYNDVRVIAGQATVGREIRRQLRGVQAIFIAVGGGGLISGCGAAFHGVRHPPTIVACQPSHSDVMYSSIKAGRILDLPSQPTLSDGTAGGIEKDAITFGLCQRLVDEFVCVNEKQIARAMRRLANNHQVIVEGAAGVAMAGFEKVKARYQKSKVVIVLCGRNVSTEVWKKVLF